MITYKVGDATRPETVEDGTTFIAHIVNDAGGWGAGFSGALSKRYPTAESSYREWHRSKELGLGKIRAVPVTSKITVVHMCAQHMWVPIEPKPIRYVALAECLSALHELMTVTAAHRYVKLAMPRIGAGLAGGDWELIEALITKEFTEVFTSTPVTVYDLE